MCTLCQCHWESPSVMPVTYDLWQLPVAPSKLVVFPTNFRLNSVSKIWGVQVHMTVNRSRSSLSAFSFPPAGRFRTLSRTLEVGN